MCRIRADDLCKVGNPASPSTGTKFEEEVDYRSEGPNPLELRRYYNGSGYYAPGYVASNSRIGGFTGHWGHNFGARIHEGDGTNLAATAVRPDGTMWHFDLLGKEVLNHGGTGAAARVEKLANNTWALTLANHDIERYDASGRLTSLTTRSGTAVSINYDGNGRISTVVDSFGKTLEFEYDVGSGQLIAVTTPAGEVIAYAYEGFGEHERLSQVTFPDTRVRKYHYEDPLQYTQLTGITDENDQRFSTYTYLTDGRVKTSEHSGGANRYEFTYTSSFVTKVKDPLGTTRTYNMNTVLGVYRLLSLTGGQRGPHRFRQFSRVG